MTIRIYNTLGKKKQVFETIEPGKVRMYVCGPTVYDSCHIGHARSVVVFDVIVRYLEASGYSVKYVRNFTDVDDKIINRANETGLECSEIAEKYIAEFYTDMDALNVRRATIEPKATEHITDIIRIIEILMDRKVAYRIENDVYFAVEKFNADMITVHLISTDPLIKNTPPDEASKTIEEVEEFVKLPVLALIPYIKGNSVKDILKKGNNLSKQELEYYSRLLFVIPRNSFVASSNKYRPSPFRNKFYTIVSI